VYPHVYEQIRASLMAPHVVMARARGTPWVEPPSCLLWAWRSRSKRSPIHPA
jgi:hypothetical protein